MSILVGKQAIVIGAGIAGLSAARALADYFEQVVVLLRGLVRVYRHTVRRNVPGPYPYNVRYE